MRPMRPAKAWGTGWGGDPARLRSRHVGHLAVIGAWRFRFVSPKPRPLTTTRLGSHGWKAKGGAVASGVPVDRVAARNDPQREHATRLALSFYFFYLPYL